MSRFQCVVLAEGLVDVFLQLVQGGQGSDASGRHGERSMSRARYAIWASHSSRSAGVAEKMKNLRRVGNGLRYHLADVDRSISQLGKVC